jgi:hypothetical protein
VQPAALRRVLDNLLDNALRHGTQARLALHREAGAVCITVDDDGPGIPEAQLDAVLDPFVQLGDADPRRHHRAGLGGDSTSSSSSATLDPLDTNEDGVVSAQERAAGELKELMQQALQAADSDGDQSLSASELSSFKDAVTQALGAATSGSGSSSSSSSGSDQDGSANGKLQEQAAKLVDWMLKQYAGAGAQGGRAFATTGTQLNVSA